MSKVSRTDPKFWDDMRLAWWKHARVPLNQYAKYARWFRGEFTESGDLSARGMKLPKDWRGALVNLTNLVTRSSRADLFFRNPRFLVRPTGSMNVKLFTPDLAHVETMLLNSMAEEMGLYRQGRRALLDGLLGPFMVFRVGYTAEFAIDLELMDAERQAADTENQKYLAAGIKMRVKDDDLHSVHIEQHNQLIASVERGDLQIPKKALDYLKKHVKKHEDLREAERPKETVRNDSIWVRRKSPMNVFFDPWAESPEEREWVGERYTVRMEDVENNTDYDREARKELRALQHRWVREANLPPVPPTDQITTPDEYCMLYEVHDLVENKVIIYAEGGSKPLLVKDYTLKDILPSGPYIDASFMEDPFEGFGICPPAVYEAHQIAATYLASVNTKTVQRSSPKLGYNATAVRKGDVDNFKKFEIAGIFPFENLPPGSKIQDMLFQIPPAEVPPQNIMMEKYHRDMVQQFSGLGAAKLAGGDTTKTATASAVVGEAVSTISEDLAAVVDDWMARTGKAVLRLARRLYTKARVAEIVGEEALEVWPWTWADRDIANDRGISVVPGSSRRNNSAVEQKLLTDFYGMIAADPMTNPTLKQEVLRRTAESMGLFGLDFGPPAPPMAQPVMGGDAENPQENAAEGGQEEPGEEPSHAAMTQGVNNVGGGRVPTGASQGDNLRAFRNKKLAGIAARRTGG